MSILLFLLAAAAGGAATQNRMSSSASTYEYSSNASSGPLPVAQLRQAIAATRAAPKSAHETQSPLWDVVLSRKLSSTAGEEGLWIAFPLPSAEHADADDCDAPLLRCVAQVIPDNASAPTKSRRVQINLFHRISNSGSANANHSSDSSDTADDRIRDDVCSILDCAIQHVSPSTDESQRIALTFGSLERCLVPHVRDALLAADPGRCKRKFFSTFSSECGMWILEAGPDDDQNLPTLADQSLSLPEGVVIRSLTQKDADLVHSCWEYRSDGSLEMIQRMIAMSEGGCVGVSVHGKLVSWMLRYLDGSIVMLFTNENYRRQGYAAIVVRGAVCDIRTKTRKHTCKSDGGSMEKERMISYIVDSNDASKSLYSKLGWRRVADADWVGFASRQPNHSS